VTDTNTRLEADVLLIGWGKGATHIAAELSTRGRRVVLVERSERMYGGTCPNVGCIPSKGLVHRSGNRRATAELRDAIYTHPSSTEAFNEVLSTIARSDRDSTLTAR
jgi:probable pyridine nucleotide-disulfide oxidoreductase